MTAADIAVIRQQVQARFTRRRRFALAVTGLILVYLAYLAFAFDLAGIAARARLDNGAILISDAYSYKTVVTRDNRGGDTVISIEGKRRGTYDLAQEPGWVHRDGQTVRLDMPKGGRITIAPDVTTYDIPGYGTVRLQLSPEKRVVAEFPPGPLPSWISASDTLVSVTAPQGRLSMSKAKTEVFRYTLGWEMFWFTVDSPYFGVPFATLAAHVVSGDRIDPARPNLQGILQDFWSNGVWHHSNVAWAMFETVLMAFLGTMGAALIALPLAFLSARNFAPSLTLRFATRRTFDLFRGIDGLIWTIILARAFGLGPLTGALAILLTDTGSFGKIFSEALENVDNRQIEGIQSTGAGHLQRYRFGVLPQVLPVLLSQVLYFLESNTRSATVIGAIVGGGIGLLLTQAIATQRDWEQVTWYIFLILAMVMVMDWLSGKVRRRLILGAR